jgi:hypothetical protein
MLRQVVHIITTALEGYVSSNECTGQWYLRVGESRKNCVGGKLLNELPNQEACNAHVM